jgi:hypothetical protein
MKYKNVNVIVLYERPRSKERNIFVRLASRAGITRLENSLWHIGNEHNFYFMTLILICREEHRLGVFENRLLRRIFGPMRWGDRRMEKTA